MSVTFITASSSLSKIYLIINSFISACFNFFLSDYVSCLAYSRSAKAFSSCSSNWGSVLYSIITSRYLSTSLAVSTCSYSVLASFASVFTVFVDLVSFFLVSPCFNYGLLGLFNLFGNYSTLLVAVVAVTVLAFSTFSTFSTFYTFSLAFLATPDPL